jgi:type IV secretion system protein TrbL
MAGIGSCLSDPLSCPGQIVGGAVGGAANDGLQAIADGAFTFMGKVLKLLTTFWINAPTPDLTSPHSAVVLVRTQLQPLAMFALTLGLLGASVRLMWNTRSGEPGAFSQAMKGIALTILVTGAGAMIVSVLLNAFDQWANHIISTGFDGKGVGEQIAALSSGASAAGPLGSIFAIVLYGLAGLSSLMQFALMLVRGPVVVLLCVMLAPTAAAAVTKEGAEAFRKVTSWLVSWILYKLIATIVYAVAFAMLGDSKDITGTVSGLILLVLAIFALPALLRLASPVTQAISGGGGQFMTAAAGAGGQIAGATLYSHAGRAAQNHQVGSAKPFSGGTGDAAPEGAAATAGPTGTPGSGGTGSSGGAGTTATTRAGAAAAGGAGGTAAVGAASGAAASGAAAAAAGPAGAATAGTQAARRSAETAAGAADSDGGSS